MVSTNLTHEYLDKQYVFSGETVNFSACCKKHDKEDLVGAPAGN